MTFSDEAGWGSNGMQERQALYWAVDTGDLVLCLCKAEVCVRCSCPGDAMGACYCCWRCRRRCRVTKIKFKSAASEAYYEVALDRFAGSRGSQFSTAWVARQVQGSQLQAARVWSDAAGLGFSGPSFSCGLPHLGSSRTTSRSVCTEFQSTGPDHITDLGRGCTVCAPFWRSPPSGLNAILPGTSIPGQ